MFRPGNLDVNLIGIDTAILSPVLKLASHFLLARFNLSYWHPLLFSDVHDAKDIIYSVKRYKCYEYLQTPSELSSAQEERTSQALRQLANRVKIKVESAKNDKPDMCGSTRRVGNDLSMITLTRQLVMGLVQYAEVDDFERRVWQSARIAFVLIHELAHAVTGLTRGPGHYFFPGSVCAEDGFEVVSRLCGGTPQMASPKLELMAKNNLVLEPWPNQNIIANYTSIGGNLGLRLLDHAPITTRPGDCVEIILFSYFERLFDQSFWDNEVAELGQEALRPPTTGWFTHKAPKEALENLRQTYKRRREAWAETARSQHAVEC